MKEEPTKLDVSQQEISVLSKALSKSVEISRLNRYVWASLLAGFLIGAGVAALIFMLAGPQKGETASDEILLKRSRETLRSVIQIQSQVDRLINEIRSTEKSEKGELPEAAPPKIRNAAEHRASQESKQSDTNVVETRTNNIDLSRFTVYIHYNGRKQTMKKFGAFLRTKGYTVPAIEHVTDRRRDIRYFHEKDREGADFLLKDLQNFLKDTAGIHDIAMESRDLSRVYPKASKGALELWIYF